MKIIERSKTWFAISLVVILIGLGFMAIRGLNYGIDFAGGTIMQVDLKKAVDTEEIKSLASAYVNDASVQTSDNTGIIVRSSSITNEQMSKLQNDINNKYGTDPASWSVETVGPSIGQELTRSALLALLIAGVAMLLYVAFRFEVKFGLAAIIALVHDILIMLAVYAVLQIPVNSSFIAAILTVVGYSINDTIVVFDRIRENMRFMRKVSYEEIANTSISQTMRRSINTSLTTLLTITVLYILGVSAVKELALPLIIGIISGTYSSIFIASPIWVMLKKRGKKESDLVEA